MEGRASGSSDELESAEFLAEKLVALDIPAAPGGYIQGFEAWARRLDQFINSQNVLAAVPGSGALSDQWIVVGAHYDHIGYRGLPGETAGPNNGADDNGSGTVTVLELARLYRKWVDGGGAGSQDRRSVLFAFWGAEEQGLLGSCHYVFDGPAVPIANTVATMNFDMVGRLRNNTVYVSGVDASDDWVPLLRNANADELNLSIRPESCAGCTDHACFWGAGVPFLGFYTGTHDEYHRPGDDVDLINFDGMMTIGGFAFRILRGLVVMPEAPGLTKPYPSG
jgi:Zn-dependent M28 family amino/carboxypeptidase